MFENSKAQLKVQAAVLEDAGVYSCVAVNDHGRAVCTACVLVTGKTHISFFYSYLPVMFRFYVLSIGCWSRT